MTVILCRIAGCRSAARQATLALSATGNSGSQAFSTTGSSSKLIPDKSYYIQSRKPSEVSNISHLSVNIFCSVCSEDVLVPMVLQRVHDFIIAQ